MTKLLYAWIKERRRRRKNRNDRPFPAAVLPVSLRCAATAFFCFLYAGITAQNTLSAEIRDTTVTASDTAAYNRIRQAMSGKKLTKRIFSLLTRKPAVSTEPVDVEVSIDRQFLPYENKTIADINVIVLPPFGYDIRKFDSVPEIRGLRKIGNSAHARTRSWVLKNSLLFRKGQKIDPLIMAETESFIRDIGYVNDVYIQIDSISETEANVTVAVRDNWSIGAYVRNVSTKIDAEVFDRNFIGLGNNLALRGILNTKTDRKFGGGVEYSYPNLMRTFININASYVDDILSSFRTLSLERPLQKSLNLFGQINYNMRETNLAYAVWDSISPTYDREFSASLGYAFNSSENDNTFVVSARVLDRNPVYKGVNRPDNPDRFQYIADKMALVQLSLFRQRYFRTRMVNSFGKTENFAYGYNVSAQLGYSEWPQSSRKGIYTSFRVASNKLYSFGNIYFEGAVSSFFHKKKPFEGMLKLKLDMFSPLWSVGNQSYRHFLNINYAKRLDGIHGFRNRNLPFEKLASMKFRNMTNYLTTEALVFKTEGNIFSSLDVLGFRFLFYSFADFGWMAEGDRPLLNKNNICWGAGLGVRIRNDLLVFRTLELRVGYYPRIIQHKFNDYVNFGSLIPNVSPNFTPKYPAEIEML